MKPSRTRLLLLGAVVLACLGAPLRAFVYLDYMPAWPDGNVTLELQLGSTPVYADGTTPNGTAIEAIKQWNPSMARVQLTYVNNSSAGKSATNGKNNVFFSATTYGTAFPEGVLAVTMGRSSGSRPTEADVVVNTAWQWDSYRGYLQYPKTDLRRVLAHEFGHVLGLAHPDQNGQWVTALMNAYVSDIDATQQDDKDGVSARYGHGAGNPAVPPTFPVYEPYDLTVLDGTSATFSCSPSGSQPITYQWLKNGVEIPGATASALALNPVSLTDSGKYSLRATNEVGSASSREATLTVERARAPTIITQPQSRTVILSTPLQLDVYATSNTPISYQWTKDGVAITGATAAAYWVQSTQSSDAGTYRVVATTSGGSVTSDPAVITLVPPPKPVFSSHPVSVEVEEGMSASFSGYATSPVSIAYQWTKDGVDIPNATGSYLSLYPVRMSDAGTYQLVATNAGGSTGSNTAVLTVRPTNPPVFQSDPQGGTFEVSANVSLYAYAYSSVAVTYQWTRNGLTIPGATSNSLELRNIGISDAGEYRLIATNFGGSVTSRAAHIAVVPTRRPEIIRPPYDVTAEAGSTIVLAVDFISGVATTVQWTLNGHTIPGATSSSLYIYNATQAASGVYRAVLTNIAGSVTSAPATVTITPTRPPQFTIQPGPLAIEEGERINLSGYAVSPVAITYQWTRNGIPIPGALSSTYWAETSTRADEGDYVLRATNVAGTTASSTARVTILPATLPSISFHPQSGTFQTGASLFLYGSYSSRSPATVRWTKDGVEIPNQTSTYFSLPNITGVDAGTYAMVVSNAAGKVTSNPAVVTIIPTLPPRFLQHPSGGVYEAGVSLWSSVQVESAVPVTLQWTKDGATVPGATGSYIYHSPLTEADSGEYRVIATNAAGSVLSNAATLKVLPMQPPVFATQPQSATVELGGTVELSTYVVSTVSPTYQWFHDGGSASVPRDPRLRLSPVKDTDAGEYKLVATNPAGSTTSTTAMITVVPATKPEFTVQPASVTVQRGDPFYIWAGVRSASNLRVQWYQDGEPVAGATNTSLNISSTAESHGGSYTLVATNAAGSVTSEPATVTVVPPGPPRITTQPQGGFALAGSFFSTGVGYFTSAPATFLWYKNGEPMPTQTSSWLTINSFSASDAGAYHVVVTTAWGSTASDEVMVALSPAALPIPVRIDNVSLVEGFSATLSATEPAGHGDVSYQWYRDGTPLPGARNSQLVINNVSRADAGIYFATISNDAGTVTSHAYLATVQRSESASVPRWTAITQAGGIVYLLNPRLMRIDRFDLVADVELEPISLSAIPTACAADESHLFIALETELFMAGLDGSSLVRIASLDGTIDRLAVVGSHVVASTRVSSASIRRQFQTFRRSDGAPEGQTAPSYTEGSSNFAVDPAGPTIYSSASVADRNTVAEYRIHDDGSIEMVAAEPLPNGFPTPLRLSVVPNQPRIVDTNGLVYQRPGLSVAGSFGLPVDAYSFTRTGTVIALRGRELTFYDDTLCPTRRMRLAAPASAIFVVGEEIVALDPDSSGEATIRSERIPLTPVAASPLPAPNPATIDYLPDDVTTDRDGNLLLLSRRHQSLFRWNVREQRYSGAVRFDGYPNHLACVRSTNIAYLGFPDRSIVAVDLDGGMTPRPVGAIPWDIGAFIATTDSLVLTLTWGNPVTDTFAVLGGEAKVLGQLGNYYPLDDLTWTQAENRVYFIRTDYDHTARPLYLDLDTGETPYGPENVAAAQSLREGPYLRFIRVSPDAQQIALPQGQIVQRTGDAATLAQIAPFADAAWTASATFVAADTASGAEIRRLNAELSTAASIVLNGRIARLLESSPGRLVAITVNHQRPVFTLLDSDLTVRRHFDDQPDLTRVHLANLSTRGRVGTGDNVMIAGFVVNGTQPKRVLVRAIGPSLHPLGVNGELSDPVLSLVDAASRPVAGNDDWATDDVDRLKAAFDQVGAFSLPETSRDAALIADLAPGRYTALVSGRDDAQGIALVETYDLDAQPGERRLINISTRAEVGVGDAVLIPGLVIQGTEPKRVLIRAVGPGMHIFGLENRLSDPHLRVMNREQQLILANDNWGEDNVDVIRASAAAAGAFSLDDGSRDAALVATLAPGIYTVVVSGIGDATGLALVEIYEVP